MLPFWYIFPLLFPCSQSKNLLLTLQTLSWFKSVSNCCQTAVGCWYDSMVDNMTLWSLISPVKIHWKVCIGWSYLLFVKAGLFIYNKASLMRSCVNITVTDKHSGLQPVDLQWKPCYKPPPWWMYCICSAATLQGIPSVTVYCVYKCVHFILKKTNYLTTFM